MSESNSGSGDSLQFDRAENADAAAASAPPAAVECSSCQSPIKTYYYHVDGNVVCAKCKQTAAQALKSHTGVGAFLKAFLVGGIAALLGAGIYYGVIAITNFEIGIVAILIGFMVGFGVRLGAGGRGGRRYQVLALVLTYFAVGVAYAPLALKGAMDSAEQTRAEIADSLAALADADSTDIASSDSDDSVDVASDADDSLTVALAGTAGDSTALAATKIGAGTVALGAIILIAGSFAMIFALPVLVVFGSLPSGLISAAIIAFGMQQAWKMTAGHTASITGPYRVGSAEPPPDPSATPAG